MSCKKNSVVTPIKLSTAKLKKLGLSEQEIKTYKYLIKLPSYTIPDITTNEGLDEFRRTVVGYDDNGIPQIYRQINIFDDYNN